LMAEANGSPHDHDTGERAQQTRCQPDRPHGDPCSAQIVIERCRHRPHEFRQTIMIISSISRAHRPQVLKKLMNGPAIASMTPWNDRSGVRSA
jgi:hypothetical protein